MRRGADLGALAAIHTFQGAAQGGVLSITNLNKYYCIAVEHDQIKLAAAAAPVLEQQPQPVLIQVGPPPPGYRYVRVANDLLLMAVGSRLVVDAITDLGRVL